MRYFTGRCRLVARLKRAAKSVGITSSLIAIGAKQAPNLRTSTSWPLHTARINNYFSITKRPLIDIFARAAFQWHTRTFSGADAARSSHRKSRHTYIGAGGQSR